jgi:hypothetical protein
MISLSRYLKMNLELLGVRERTLHPYQKSKRKNG